MSSVQIKELGFDFIPLDKDLLSMEISSAFEKLTMEQDLQIFRLIAYAIGKTCLCIGKINSV